MPNKNMMIVAIVAIALPLLVIIGLAVIYGLSRRMAARQPAYATDPLAPMVLVAPFQISKAADAQAAWAQYADVEKTLINDIGMHFTLIPPGRFEMGSTKRECEEAVGEWPKIDREWVFREQPKHTVVVSRPFYLGTYEITIGQFRQFVAATGHKINDEWLAPGFPQADDHPVVNVSWHDARAFVKWLNRADVVYRLPTEAEWEYACRAGTTARFPHGNDAEQLPSIANVADSTLADVFPEHIAERIQASDGFAYTAPVGQFSANQFGIHDMIGNVHEWCQDWHGASYYRSSPESDPRGPKRGTVRACRGGGWYDGPRDCRAANRGWLPPESRYFNLGFRIVRDIEMN